MVGAEGDSVAFAPPSPARLADPPTRTKGSSWLLRVATALSALVAVGWIWSVAATAGRGLDLSDESFYLLSYRWWNTDLRTFSGAQYLYGPVFGSLGHNIAALRGFRLLTVLAAHSIFAGAFVRWLRLHRPDAPRTYWWEAAIGVALVASGGAVYGWLPLSPGYNDVSVLGSLLLGALVLHLSSAAGRGRSVAGWQIALVGPVAVGMTLAKWSSFVAVAALVAVIGTAVLRRRGWREVGRVAAWAAGGAVSSLAVVHLAVIPLTKAVPLMLQTTGYVAAATNSPAQLLHMYISTTGTTLRDLAHTYPLLLVAAVLAPTTRGRVGQLVTGTVAVAGLVLGAIAMTHDKGLVGGPGNLPGYVTSLALPVVLLAVMGIVASVMTPVHRAIDRQPASTKHPPPGTQADSEEHHDRTPQWPVVVMLLLLPVTQAAGTGNPILWMAVNGFATWSALVIWVATGIRSAPLTARALAGSGVAMAVAFPAVVAMSSLWHHPYRTAAPAAETAHVAGAKSLSSLRLDPQRARAYAALRLAVAPWTARPGRPVMAFDELPGLVLLLDGRSVGEAWYSATDHARTAAGIEAECATGPLRGAKQPLLFFHRPVLPSDTQALHACGLSLGANYRELTSLPASLGLTVYVPR